MKVNLFDSITDYTIIFGLGAAVRQKRCRRLQAIELNTFVYSMS
jgi:hypothetical protein